MLIVFNPVAGRRRAHLLWRVLDVLVANGVRLDLAETHRAGHAEALAREAARRGEPMVVAAGGDGTIAEVANGLMGPPPGSASSRSAPPMSWRMNLACRSRPNPSPRHWRSAAPARCGPARPMAPTAPGCSCRCWASALTPMSCTTCRSR